MRASFRSEGELQPLLQPVQGQTGQAADQRTVEADILQVVPDGELDPSDQYVDVPGFHLIGDEPSDAALLALHEVAQHTHHAAIDLGPDRRVALQLPTDIDQHRLELTPDVRFPARHVALEKSA